MALSELNSRDPALRRIPPLTRKARDMAGTSREHLASLGGAATPTQHRPQGAPTTTSVIGDRRGSGHVRGWS